MKVTVEIDLYYDDATVEDKDELHRLVVGDTQFIMNQAIKGGYFAGNISEDKYVVKSCEAKFKTENDNESDE